MSEWSGVEHAAVSSAWVKERVLWQFSLNGWWRGGSSQNNAVHAVPRFNGETHVVGSDLEPVRLVVPSRVGLGLLEVFGDLCERHPNVEYFTVFGEVHKANDGEDADDNDDHQQLE